jgi:hypothetical protein
LAASRHIFGFRMLLDKQIIISDKDTNLNTGYPEQLSHIQCIAYNQTFLCGLSSVGSLLSGNFTTEINKSDSANGTEYKTGKQKLKCTAS